ncbi:MAG: hypothetical protein ACPGO3_01785 [Magnetospiraceae bacterium]
MERRRVIGLLAASPVIGLAGCATASERAPVQPARLEFYNHPPVRLRVSRIDIAAAAPGQTTEYLPPAMAPAAVLTRWAEQRLQAVGGTALARYTIFDAAARSEALPVTKGVRGVLRDEQAEKLIVSLGARLDVREPSGSGLGIAYAQVMRFQTLPESASPADRDQAWFDLMETAANGFDEDMVARIRGDLVNLVVS